MATLNVRTYQSLCDAQSQYISQLDSVAELARENLATIGTSQARVYEAKVKEAQEGGGPLIEAEALALSISEEEVISRVLKAYQSWKESCGVIEGLRLKAKDDIRAAQSPTEMYNTVKKFKEKFNVVQ